ncbi:MAG: helix-turn-helix domain-containing protein, partial [Desulfobacterales bacterium]|jgi:DNA-binding NtrC family response regulator
LRNRPEDIPYLIDYYIKEYADQFDGKKLARPSSKTIDKLLSYTWPGNVRELQNILKRIMILGEDEETIDDLLSGAGKRENAAGVQSALAQPSIPIELVGLNGENAANLSSLSLKKIRKKALDRVEKEVITYVLEKTGWNRSKATKILNISYKTLLYKIKDLGIVPPSDSTE